MIQSNGGVETQLLQIWRTLEPLISGDTKQIIQLEGDLMVGTELVRTEHELREFYEWLLCRAQEEESCGKTNNGRVYRDYAETVSQEISRL